jgi:hypothetical protein
MNLKFNLSHQYEMALVKGDLNIPWKEYSFKQSQMTGWWSKNENKINMALYDVAKLKFKSDILVCYLNSKITVSDPLSLKFEDVEDMKDNLIHELIHILLTQNYSKIRKTWDKFYSKSYQEESPATRTHMAVHSIHYLVTQNIRPGRIKHIKTYSLDKDYIRSWELVDTIGPDSIINQCCVLK